MTAAELTIAAGKVVIVMPGIVYEGCTGLSRSLEEVGHRDHLTNSPGTGEPFSREAKSGSPIGG